MSYGYAYVASVSLGANRAQTQKAFQEAVNYKGPSIIFAYSPCINHGINMRYSQLEQKKAVEAGYWPLYRYNPKPSLGEKFKWESKDPDGKYRDFILSEVRYASLKKTNPAEAEMLYKESEDDAYKRLGMYKNFGDSLNRKN